MKHLVLYYDKYRTFSPQTKLFDDVEAMEQFVTAKVNAGVDCYTYNFAEKFIKQQIITSTKTI